jgi:hypothetical protein
MKALFYAFALSFFASIATAQTTVRIVDHNFNAPTGANIYSTLQAAVTASGSGDIIQVQPSATAYGHVTINKPLTLMGIGFNLTKEIPYQSTIGNVTLTSNVGSTENASGSIITGLTITTLTLGTVPGPAYVLSDVSIYNCIITTINGPSGVSANLNNLDIYANYITSSIRIYNTVTGISWFRNNVLWANYLDFRSASPSSITITNNIMYGFIVIIAATTSIPILNNNFIGASPSTYSFGSINEKIVSNNIFYGRTPHANAAGTASGNLINSIFTYNLSISTGNDAFPPAGATNSGNNNLQTVSPALTNVPVSSNWSIAYDYTLMTGSAAIDAGSDGTDIGITGGFFPWTEGNLVLKTSAAPTIEILNTSAIINPTDPLPVRVKAKSN